MSINTTDRDNNNISIASLNLTGIEYPLNMLVDPSGTLLTPFHTGLVSTANPTQSSAALPVAQKPSVQWVASFPQVGSSLLSPFLTQRTLGTGMAVSQSAGNLVLTTGTSTNSEFLARSLVSFNGAWIARHQVTLSQRIANNNFVIMLADKIGEGLACTINSATSISVTKAAHGLTAANVGQSMCIGGITGAAGVPGRYAIASIPDANTINFTVAGWPASGTCTLDVFGWNYVRALYNGTTATNVALDAQRQGWATGDTVATINTTAAPGHILQANASGRDLYWSDSLAASSTAPVVTTRASRLANIPDADVELYVYVWSFNGSAAPATTTTLTVGFIAVEDTVNVPMYLAGIRMQGQASPIPIQYVGTQTVTLNALPAGTNAVGDVGLQLRANATGAATISHIVSAATTNAANIKASAGRVVGWSFTNTTASFQYVKLHNTAAAPTAGASVVMTIAIPPNSVNNMPVGGAGIGFATGIGRSIVTGSADADATATTAGAVVGDLFYA